MWHAANRGRGLRKCVQGFCSLFVFFFFFFFFCFFFFFFFFSFGYLSNFVYIQYKANNKSSFNLIYVCIVSIKYFYMDSRYSIKMCKNMYLIGYLCANYLLFVF